MRSAHGVTPSSELDHLLAAAFAAACGASPEVSCPCSARGRRDSPSPGLPRPVRSAFRVSHPPDGLLPLRPSGLVSCRWRSWGSSPSELLPPTEAVSPLGDRNPPDVGSAMRGAASSGAPNVSAAASSFDDQGRKASGSRIRRRPSSSRVARLQGVAPRWSPSPWPAALATRPGSMLSWGSCLFRVLRRPRLAAPLPAPLLP
jgi:hypothetical protein